MGQHYLHFHVNTIFKHYARIATANVFIITELKKFEIIWFSLIFNTLGFYNYFLITKINKLKLKH